MRFSPTVSMPSSPESLVCIIVLMIHLVLAIVIGLALGIRYGYYGDHHFYDMPSDMRVLQPHQPHIFCENMQVQTKFEKQVILSDEIDHQLDMTHIRSQRSERGFDLYVLKDGKLPNKSRHRFTEFFFQDALKPGRYSYASFHLLKRSSIRARFCKIKAMYAERDALHQRNHHGRKSQWFQDVPLDELGLNDNLFMDVHHSGYWFYVVSGHKNLTTWIQNHHSHKSACDGNVCLYRHHISSVETSNCSNADYPEHQYMLGVPSDQTYFFVFSLPQKMGDVHYDLPIEVDFKVNRSVYDLSTLERPLCQNVMECTAAPSKPLLIDLAYYSSPKRSIGPSDSLIVVHACVPNLLVYLGIFFVLPVLTVAAASCIVCVCKGKKTKIHYRFVSKRRACVNTYGAIANTSSEQSQQSQRSV